MKDVPKFEAEALLYHEGIPGHHFQIALAIELKNLPKIRRYGSYTAFSEGWGLYAERLGKEMGATRIFIPSSAASRWKCYALVAWS